MCEWRVQKPAREYRDADAPDVAVSCVQDVLSSPSRTASCRVNWDHSRHLEWADGGFGEATFLECHGLERDGVTI